MNEYLNYINKINPFYYDNDYSFLIGLMKRYILGNISSMELVNSIPDEVFPIFYIFLNRVLTYTNEKYRYYIELPTDINFSTNYPKGVIYSRVYSNCLMSDLMRPIGHKWFSKNIDFFDSNFFIQIKGDFSSTLNGGFISNSDYFKIISKWDGLYSYLESLVDYDVIDLDNDVVRDIFMKKLNNKIEQGINSKEIITKDNWWFINNQTSISSDVINSIDFCSERLVLGFDEVLSGDFGEFNNLVKKK